MNLITSLRLKNFRGFTDSCVIPLAPLTFLVGPNSSGKSTIVNALMFVAQSHSERSTVAIESDWMGRLVDLGSFEDTVHGHNTKLTMSIELGLRFFSYDEHKHRIVGLPKHEMLWRWEINDAKSEAGSPNFSSGFVSQMTIHDCTSGAELEVRNSDKECTFGINGDWYVISKTPDYPILSKWPIQETIYNYLSDKSKNTFGKRAGYKRISEFYSSSITSRAFAGFERVSSARSGPKRWVAKSSITQSDSSTKGQLNDAYALNLGSPAGVTSKRHSAARESIAKYMRELGIGTALSNVELSAYHSALKITDSVNHVRSNLADVGFGASQVIPVLKGCLNESFGPLVIEQPEIHLHPRAQGILATLICESSARRQILVETHSEHMINRARIQVAQGSLHHSDVVILYIDRAPEGTTVTRIGLTPDGDFEQEWPEGFFDERYNDSMKLLDLKSQSSETYDIIKNSSKRIKRTKPTGIGK